eukprot:Polyplicarium_translucidae@DN2865_c0_g1_i2.p2
MLIRKGKFQELLRQRGGTHLSSQLVDLLSKMLSPDFQTRPTPLQCLAHPWFKSGVARIFCDTCCTCDVHLFVQCRSEMRCGRPHSIQPVQDDC